MKRMYIFVRSPSPGMLARTPIMLSWRVVSQTFTVAHRSFGRLVAALAGKAAPAQQATAATMTKNRVIGRSP
jgi:hypothetical protein